MGGVETYMTSLGEKLVQMGHDVQYFGMQDERNVVGNKFDIYIKKIDLQKKSIKNIFLPLKIIYSLEAKRKIKKLSKQSMALDMKNLKLCKSILTHQKPRHNAMML
jgi:hypothetical protein